MNIRKTALAAMVAGALGIPMVASGITIDGITFEPGSIFELGELWEAEALNDGIGNDNTVIDQLGEVLIGVGRITSIRAADNSLLWSAGDNGRELTIHFYDYVAESIAVSVDPLGSTTAQIAFSGGLAELYSQASGVVLPTTTQAAGILAATTGNLWLTLAGAPLVGTGAFGAPITLTSLAVGVDVNNPLGSGNVFGQGRLDVTGGPAGPYLDTNTFECLTGQGAPNCPYASDKSLSSEGGLQPNAEGEWAFSGNLTVRDVAVPEPGTIALLGLGLAGLGYGSRRKAKASG